MDAAALKAWLALLRAPGIGPVAANRLLDQFGDPAAVLAASPASLRAAALSDSQIASLGRPDWAGVEQDLRWLQQGARHFVCRDDPAFPAALRALPQPPAALFCQGDPGLLGQPQLAIVGARSATPQGLENARAFAAELARRGLIVTSGLALGIDGAAHRGALEAGGTTIAVCGTGLDRVYPARHRELAHDIASRGLLVSEFPVGTPAQAGNFPRRNRLIAALSLGVLVVEAARESGSLITARLATEQGREVFAIPGSIHNPMARGCHALIRQGAKLVETADDILVELAPQLREALRPATGPEHVSDAPDTPIHPLLEWLDDEPIGFAQLQARSGWTAESLSEALLQLELAGALAALPGGRYQRLRHR